MSHERRLAVGLLLLTLLVKDTLSEDTWVDKVERRVKQKLGDSIQWISGPDHKHDLARREQSSFIRKLGIGIAIAFGCLGAAIAGFCAFICARKRRNAQRAQPLVGASCLTPATSGSSVPVGPGYPNPQGPQPCSQPWSQAPYCQHQPQQPYPPSYISSYPQRHAQMPEHLGATAPPSVPTAPPVSFEQMPMPPPPYDYKDYKDPSRY
uniref:Putative secreted protein n=1 Tax=Ixodes ricinus TaxID=34613 RepID=A0A131Y5F9_IXORI